MKSENFDTMKGGRREDKVEEVTRRIDGINQRIIKEKEAANVTIPEDIYFAEIKEYAELIREALRRHNERRESRLHSHQNRLDQKAF